jgi:hypothetical protein
VLQDLIDTATACEDAGSRFVRYLDSLIPNPKSSNPLRCAKASIKFHWVHQKIEDFVARLDKLRDTLALAIALALRKSTDTNSEDIMAQLKAIQLDGSDNVATSSEIKKTIQVLVDTVKQQAGQNMESIQCQIRQCLDQLTHLRQQTDKTKEENILRWLDFRQMSWRYQEIDDAYHETFGWVFDEQEGDTKWDNFAAYLSSPDCDTAYFINGKAGSGKSTLMKYLMDSPETECALRQWAGCQELLVVGFFFWNLGSTLQKSHKGMLRALLYTILERYPGLIPLVLPNEYQQ